MQLTAAFGDSGEQSRSHKSRAWHGNRSWSPGRIREGRRRGPTAAEWQRTVIGSAVRAVDNAAMTDDAPPFTRLSCQVLVQNAWHRYCRDRYVRRDGTIGEYFYVDMTGSTGIVPMFPDGSTVLLRVRRYLLGCSLWEFPIGGMRPGEAPEDVARHELEEEAGLTADRWDLLGKFAPYKGASTEVCWFFAARDLTWTVQRLEASEDISVHRMRLDEARRLLVEQELGDGQSLVGLMLLDRWLAKQSG